MINMPKIMSYMFDVTILVRIILYSYQRNAHEKIKQICIKIICPDLSKNQSMLRRGMRFISICSSALYNTTSSWVNTNTPSAKRVFRSITGVACTSSHMGAGLVGSAGATVSFVSAGRPSASESGRLLPHFGQKLSSALRRFPHSAHDANASSNTLSFKNIMSIVGVRFGLPHLRPCKRICRFGQLLGCVNAPIV